MLLHNILIKTGDFSASLQITLWQDSPEFMIQKRPLILICPGGGYQKVSDREADPVAAKFYAMGYHTAILRYSVAPAPYPTALLQLAGAMKLIRDRSNQWLIDTDKIIVAGFSAGGHLACSLGVFWREEFLGKYYKCNSEIFRPNGLILGYPVITSGEYAHEESFVNLLGDQEDLIDKVSLEHLVNEDMPPAFLWHTDSDPAVPVENSLLLYMALHQYNIPAEFHVFQNGGHGLSLATPLSQGSDGRGIQKECQTWIDLAHTWIKSNFDTFT